MAVTLVTILLTIGVFTLMKGQRFAGGDLLAFEGSRSGAATVWIAYPDEVLVRTASLPVRFTAYEVALALDPASPGQRASLDLFALPAGMPTDLQGSDLEPFLIESRQLWYDGGGRESLTIEFEEPFATLVIRLAAEGDEVILESTRLTALVRAEKAILARTALAALWLALILWIGAGLIAASYRSRMFPWVIATGLFSTLIIAGPLPLIASIADAIANALPGSFVTRKLMGDTAWALAIGLAVLVTRRTFQPVSLWLAAGACVLFAASAETLQFFLPQRTPTLQHGILGVIAALIALLIAERLPARRPPRRRRRSQLLYG
ncbi:MAG: hypothetical protein ACFB6S_02405 [Geminicoccaceae bacterium]